MLTRTVTLNIPEQLYSRAERAAHRLHQRVDEVLIKAVDTALPGEANLPAELAQAMDSLIFLNDEALWQAARMTLSLEDSTRLEELITEGKVRALSPDKEEQRNALIGQYQRVMLIRAKAAVLLHSRGYDVSELTTFAPLE